LFSTLLNTSNPEHTIVRGQEAAEKWNRGEENERKNRRREGGVRVDAVGRE
jgi:hypothetical protein